MTAPLVSVIIPVGPAHVDLVAQAVASVAWQTVASWCEAIVIDDSGDLDPDDLGCSFLSTGGKRGPAYARNLGIAHANGAFCLFLDADDYLLPGGVEALLRGYADNDAGYIYSDVYTARADTDVAHIGRSPDYMQGALAHYNLHVVTALVPTAAVRLVDGFDDGAAGFEDWTLYLRLAMAGICGHRIPQLTMVYRTDLGERRAEHGQNGAPARALMDQVLGRHTNEQGVIEMAACCGGVPETREQTAAVLRTLPTVENAIIGGDGTIRMEFTGDQRGDVPYRSPITGQTYRVGNNAKYRFVQVDPQDVEWLQQVAEVRVTAPVAPYVAPPVLSPGTDSAALRPRGRMAK